MFQITIDLDPVIAQYGPLALRWYSLAIMAAILIVVSVTRREFIRRQISLQHFDALVIGTVVAAGLGARLLYVIDHPERFTDRPLRMLAFQDGGLAIYGAIIGGIVAVAVVSRFSHLPFLQVIDATTPGILLGQAVGRFGCIVNGDAWGAPTGSPFAFIYTNPHAFLPPELLGVPTHPYPVYDMALNLTVFAIIWHLRKRPLPAGTLFAAFAALYAAGRFVISFVRQEQVWFWGLQEAQVIALIALVASCIALGMLLHRRGRSGTALSGSA